MKTNKPVSPYFDKDNNFIGVRVKALEEDFVIMAHNFKGGKYMTWQETMDALKEKGFTTWNMRQISLTIYYRDEIDAVLTEYGGDPLNRWYWTCAEYSAYSAFYYHGTYGYLTSIIKNYTGLSRALLALTVS